jgi:iron complex transport system permease protein
MNQSLVETRKLLLKHQYNQSQSKKKIFTFILIPLVFLVGGLAVAFGSADIAFADVYRTIFSKLFPSIDIFQETTSIIIWKLRLPRVFMGILAGIALGSSGAVMQVILKNPLADPYMLGISSAAGFGASLAIIFEIGIFSGSYLIIGNAFVFSILSAVLILVLSGKRNSTPEKMVLIGLALLFFFQALTTMLQYFGDSDAVKAAVFWTVGDLGKST